jgi:hypothetical protein
MDCIKEKYVYKGKDETYVIIRKIEQVVNLLAEKEHSAFDSMYAHFLESDTYRAIQEPRSLMWYENAEFLVDEYYREKEETR